MNLKKILTLMTILLSVQSYAVTLGDFSNISKMDALTGMAFDCETYDVPLRIERMIVENMAGSSQYFLVDDSQDITIKVKLLSSEGNKVVFADQNDTNNQITCTK